MAAEEIKKTLEVLGQKAKTDYQLKGYSVLRGFYSQNELSNIHAVLLDFHQLWVSNNRKFYNTKAINSACLTHSSTLTTEQRQAIFNFLGSDKTMSIVSRIFPSSPAFMNTQLFFDPVNDKQENYWHLDVQYNPMSIDQQKRVCNEVNVIHFRTPLVKEKGIELVPTSHNRWDTEQEYDIRMGQKGRNIYDSLTQGAEIDFDAGDIANILRQYDSSWSVWIRPLCI